jgi:hypothetical protein
MSDYYHYFLPMTSSPTDPETDADVVVIMMSGSGVVVEGNVVVGIAVVGMAVVVVGRGVDGLIGCGVPTEVVGLYVCSAKGNTRSLMWLYIKTYFSVTKLLKKL